MLYCGTFGFFTARSSRSCHVRIEPSHVHDLVRVLVVRRKLLEKQLKPLDQASAGEIALEVANDLLFGAWFAPRSAPKADPAQHHRNP
jgi:hypothetical protein